MVRIATLVGSLREGSINRKLAHAIAALTDDLMEMTFVDIGALPHYNEDRWSDPPEAVLKMKQQVNDADGVLFVTPEYNRNVPGVLCNALDWGSRPVGESSWQGKPAAVLSASPGAIGGAVAAQHMRARAVALGMHVLSHPEVYLNVPEGFFTGDGVIAPEGARDFLRGWAEGFAAFTGKLAELP